MDDQAVQGGEADRHFETEGEILTGDPLHYAGASAKRVRGG
jgi:hypothetical protein